MIRTSRRVQVKKAREKERKKHIKSKARQRCSSQHEALLSLEKGVCFGRSLSASNQRSLDMHAYPKKRIEYEMSMCIQSHHEASPITRRFRTRRRPPPANIQKKGDKKWEKIAFTALVPWRDGSRHLVDDFLHHRLRSEPLVPYAANVAEVAAVRNDEQRHVRVGLHGVSQIRHGRLS